MRKADYAILAEILKCENKHSTRLENSTMPEEYAKGYGEAVSVITFALSEGLHVDKAAFLKACGID